VPELKFLFTVKKFCQPTAPLECHYVFKNNTFSLGALFEEIIVILINFLTGIHKNIILR
jgi:hypothetical protein